MKVNATYDTDSIQSNIVSKSKLKKIQSAVLSTMKDAIVCSMGPAGSNTLILKGNNSNVLVAEYSKDGNKIIKNIKFANPIEMSIQTEIEDITRHVEKTVGDGTSSAVVLSSIIFDKLLAMDESISGNPYQVMRDFKTVVEKIKERIMLHKHDCTLDDIYNITLISTNGNEELASQMVDIYNEYGMDVFIDVSASIDENSYIKDYNGLTIDCGYSDPAYINTQEGVSRLVNPRIYAFEDPIDTPEMVAYFETILQKNCLENVGFPDKWIPTVILAPKISRDMAGLMRKLVSYLYNFSTDEYTQKPPILVITNIAGISVNHYDHIAELCGCKKIRKYIDPEIQKKDQETGLAPTLENVVDFCGYAECVEADANNTKFINPDQMYEKNEDGTFKVDTNGNQITSKKYDSIITGLESELKKAIDENEHAGVAGSLKRQLNALKANMVEYFVGGVSISDRDSLRDLVEDAVLNCRSASANGVGYGANFEGYRAVCELKMDIKESDKLYKYYDMIEQSYFDIIEILYSTALSGDELENTLQIMKENMPCPYNIATGSFDCNVLTSIMSDITILDTISKIIGIMFTSNQALVQAPQLNMY